MPGKWEDKEVACTKKEMKKIWQRIKQEQKRKSVGRTSLINFSVAMVQLGSVPVRFRQFWQCSVPITEPATG